MSVELLRLRRGTSEQNSRAIERKVRSIMTTFTELDMHYEVERKSRTNIVLAPTFDEPMADFEGDVELLKEQLADDPLIMLHRSLSTVLNTGDSSSDDDGSDIGQYVQHRDWTFTSDDDFVPGQAASSTPPPAAAYQRGRDTGYTGLFGRPNTTVVPQGRPAQGPYSVAPFQIKYDTSSDDDSYHSTTRGVGDPGSGDDTDDTYFYQSDDSDDTSLDDSDSEDSDDMISDDSDDDAHSDFTLDDDSDDSFSDAQSSDDESMDDARDTVGNYQIKDHYDLTAFNRAVDNAEMRTTAGEPETTEQRDLAKRIAKAIAGTSSFTTADTLDKNGRPKPLSELMRMARVTSLWPVLSELQKDQYMQTTGVLAHDRHYIARNVQFGAPIRKKRPFVINAQGQKIVV